jgi:hypothetical protein
MRSVVLLFPFFLLHFSKFFKELHEARRQGGKKRIFILVKKQNERMFDSKV